MSNNDEERRKIEEEHEDERYLSEFISIIQAMQMSKTKEESLSLHNEFSNLQLEREKEIKRREEKINQIKRWYF